MNGEILLRNIEAGQPIMIDDIDSPYSANPALKAQLHQRGI
jgi:hypothetical protein